MKKGLLLTTCMAALLGVGVFAGVSVGNDTTKEADAARMLSNGSVIIKKDDNTIKSRDRLVVYFFNDNANGWGSPVANDANTYQEYTWSLGFTPTKLIVLNVNSSWNVQNPWSNIHARTGDVTIASTDVVWMKNTAWDSNSNWGTYSIESYVKGGSVDDWGTETQTINHKLTSYKLNGGSKLEVYGEVVLQAGTYFKVVQTGNASEVWCGNYSTYKAIEDNFDGGGNSNIHNTSAGTYEFYFDFDGQTTYITDPVKASADEWAQNFTKATQDEVPGCTRTRNAWAELRDSYNSNASKYSTAFTSLFVNETYHAPDYEGELSFIGQAMQRYDLVLQRYGIGSANTDADGYQDFVGRAGKIPSLRGNFAMPIAESSNNGATIAIIVAFAAVTAIGGFVFFKKKKLTK